MIDYSEAIRLNPESELAHGFRGRAFTHLGDFDRALADCDRAIQLNANSGVAYRNRGELYAKKGQYKIAINDLNKSLALDPEDSLCLFTRSIFYYELRDFKNALADLINGVKFANFPMFVFNQDDSDINVFKNATMDMTAYIRENPASAGAYFFRALAFEKLKDRAKAISDLTQAIQIDPYFAFAYFKRSTLYIFNDPAKALMDLDRAIELDNTWVFPIKLRASLHSSAGENDLALLDLTRIVQLQPKVADSYVQRSFLLVDMERYDEAILDCDRAIAVDPHCQQAYFNRGIAHSEKKQPELEKSLADETRAIQLDPMDAKSITRRGLILVKMGYIDNALTDFKQAALITKDPELKSNLMALISLYSRSGTQK